MPQFNTTFLSENAFYLSKLAKVHRARRRVPNHNIHLTCHCPILPITAKLCASALGYIFREGELIAKPGHCFNWGDPWNQRRKSSKMIYWWMLWINRSEIHTGKGFFFSPEECLSVCPKWVWFADDGCHWVQISNCTESNY